MNFKNIINDGTMYSLEVSHVLVDDFFVYFQKVKLLSFEEQFDEKVQQVDFKYQQKINDLITQNIELR